MKVRQQVFDTYWRFAAARQEVFFARLRDDPPPWTADPILTEYKFTNAYRASDRVSQYLIRHVIYGPEQDLAEEETLFRVLLFKMFNKIETWRHLEARLGRVGLANFSLERYAALLQEAVDSGEAIYTSAYMSCATKAYGYDRKHENHLALVRQMTQRDRIIGRITGAREFREVFELLASYPLIGKFMAYQLATDINYSPLTNFSENSFTVAGPGAERGIAKCFEDTGGHDHAYIIQWMAEHQDEEFRRLGLTFQSLWGRPLHYIDCQNLFCETDKYSRVAFPELRSNRVRVKHHFRPTAGAIDYFYPPKWGLNERIVALRADSDRAAAAHHVHAADVLAEPLPLPFADVEPLPANRPAADTLLAEDEPTDGAASRVTTQPYRQTVLEL